MSELTVLLSCGGRRAELGEIFAQAGYRVVSADGNRTVPTLYTTSRGLLLPSVSAVPDAYTQSLLSIVGDEAVDVVVPLIDPELPVLARMHDALRAIGCVANISSVPSVDAASDKAATASIFRQSDLKVPQTEAIEGVLDNDIKTVSGCPTWPAVLKPRHGSAGKGIIRVPSCEAALNALVVERPADYVLQQQVVGDEITMDVFGDGSGRVVSVVQRQRLKIRGGEVERGVTVKTPQLFEDAIALAVVFRPYGSSTCSVSTMRTLESGGTPRSTPGLVGAIRWLMLREPTFPGIWPAWYGGRRYRVVWVQTMQKAYV